MEGHTKRSHEVNPLNSFLQTIYSDLLRAGVGDWHERVQIGRECLVGSSYCKKRSKGEGEERMGPPPGILTALDLNIILESGSKRGREFEKSFSLFNASPLEGASGRQYSDRSNDRAMLERFAISFTYK